ncbi:MAG TPA: class I SAM-dependent methyltransferase [Vineibacter sp.]|nr:class I SAM-dependent methyltransferase [Vineibacter sp.]
MSRLDSFIRRMQAQRDCLDWAATQVRDLAGPVLEIGLGNGRTYDHLRLLLPGRDIYVFEREVKAHPDCVPPDDRLFLGDVRESIPRAARRLGRVAALIHSDLGTGDHKANTVLGEWLGPALGTLLAPGGYVVANQPLEVPRWTRLPEPPDVPRDRYFLYRAQSQRTQT